MRVVDDNMQPHQSALVIFDPSAEQYPLTARHPVDDVAEKDGFADLRKPKVLKLGVCPDMWAWYSPSGPDAVADHPDEARRHDGHADAPSACRSCSRIVGRA